MIIREIDPLEFDVLLHGYIFRQSLSHQGDVYWLTCQPDFRVYLPYRNDFGQSLVSVWYNAEIYLEIDNNYVDVYLRREIKIYSEYSSDYENTQLVYLYSYERDPNAPCEPGLNVNLAPSLRIKLWIPRELHGKIIGAGFRPGKCDCQTGNEHLYCSHPIERCANSLSNRGLVLAQTLKSGQYPLLEVFIDGQPIYSQAWSGDHDEIAARLANAYGVSASVVSRNWGGEFSAACGAFGGGRTISSITIKRTGGAPCNWAPKTAVNAATHTRYTISGDTIVERQLERVEMMGGNPNQYLLVGSNFADDIIPSWQVSFAGGVRYADSSRPQTAPRIQWGETRWQEAYKAFSWRGRYINPAEHVYDLPQYYQRDDGIYSGLYTKIGPITVDNPGIHGEPEYYYDDDPESGCPKFSWGDWRVLLMYGLSELRYKAFEISFNYSQLALNFAALQQSQIQATNCAAELQSDGILIKDIQPGAAVRLDYTPSAGLDSPNLQGGRYARLIIDTDAEHAINIEMRPPDDANNLRAQWYRRWRAQISNGQAEFDLLAPEEFSDASGVDLRPMAALMPAEHYMRWGNMWYHPGISYGLHYPDLLTISGFESGREYKLKGIALARKPEEQDGFTALWVINEGCWMGRNTDGSSMAPPNTDLANCYAGNPAELPGPEYTGVIESWFQPIGYLVIDGIIAAMVFGYRADKWQHAQTGKISWKQIDLRHIDDFWIFPRPSNGIINISVLAEPPIPAEERYTSYLINKFPSRLPIQPIKIIPESIIKFDWAEIPLGFRWLALHYTKIWRTLALVQAPGRQVVDIKAEWPNNSVNQSIFLSKIGIGISPAFNQHAEAVMSSEGVVSRVESRNRLVMPAYLFPSEIMSKGKIAATQSDKTNRRYVAIARNDGVYLQIIDDTSMIERSVTTDIPQHGLDCDIIIDDKQHYCVVVYDINNQIKTLASSDEGQTWQSWVVVMGQNPRITYNEQDGVLLMIYKNEGKLYARRKLGDAAWGDAIEIAQINNDDDYDVYALRREREITFGICITRGEQIQHLLSSDGGRTWQPQ